MAEVMYEVLALRYASRMTTRSEVFLNYHLYGEPDGPIQMDYFVWVIRNEERTVVVDSGYGADSARRRGREFLKHPVELLRLAGADPSRVSHLAVTHAHYDHIGNLGAFPVARIIMSQSERDFWRGPTADRMLFNHACEVSELDQLRELDDQGRLELFTGHHAIAPGIEMIELGGHTHGQSILTVPTSDGLVVLASDAVHYYEEIDEDRPFVIVDDLDKMYRGFDTLRGLRDEGAVILPGHDPDVMRRHRPLAGDLAGHGVAIGDL